MFCITERHGIGAESWNAIPSLWSLLSSLGAMPSTVTVPLVGLSRPARIRKIVDLPQPEGPSNDRKLPLSEWRVVSCRAVTDLLPSLKTLLSPEMVMPLPKTFWSWAAALEELMKMLEERLREQHKKHQGGNKMIGTGGTSPFGAYGDHPEGVRIGGPGRKRSAVKVWEQRKYQNLDDDQILGTRQMQMALRRLRKFARQGAAEELDIDGTIRETAKQGILDVQLVPERRNRIKVLMLFDVGGSMDSHIAQCEKLFSAAKTEFKTLEYFYFHNCLYDYVWKDNVRRSSTRMNTWDLFNTYGRDYRVIVVGDASMAPYELNSVGGSVEYMNDEAGNVWLQRLRNHFEKTAWLNPEEDRYWHYTHTIGLIKQIFEDHMYPMTLKGVEDMTKYLAR